MGPVTGNECPIHGPYVHPYCVDYSFDSAADMDKAIELQVAAYHEKRKASQ